MSTCTRLAAGDAGSAEHPQRHQRVAGRGLAHHETRQQGDREGRAAAAVRAAPYDSILTTA